MKRPRFPKGPCPECRFGVGHTESCKEGARRRSAIFAFWNSLPEIPPCKFCGRLVLAGICCQAALDAAKEK